MDRVKRSAFNKTYIKLSTYLVFVCGQVFEWADVYVPSGKEVKYCFYNEHRDAVELFETDGIAEVDSLDNIANRLIKTVKIKTYLNVLRTYLLQEIPFTMIGPSGSGTRYVHSFIT